MMQSLWYPYAQMQTMASPLEVSGAKGVHLHLDSGEALIDGISSWWCAIHGYSHPVLTQAMHDQIDQLPHVMLGGLTHSPATQLADKLVSITPDGLSHVFFSDSGSVGVEVALKMALQYWHNSGATSKRRFLSLHQSYHGDTCGAISVGDPQDGMHAAFAGVFQDTFFVSPPEGGFEASDDAIQLALRQLKSVLNDHHQELAAFIVEPLMQGAGGFVFYPPAYLSAAMELCRSFDVLVIFDEVATGFGRTGRLFASNWVESSPDIMVLGKALTGGYIGHAATLASETIYNAFLDESESKAFMHGPTFMANPLACRTALASIDLFFSEDYLSKVSRIETILTEELIGFEAPGVKTTRVLGGVGVIEVDDPEVYDGFSDYAASNGVWLRPFSSIIYTAPPYVIEESQLRQLTTVMKSWFKTK